MHFSNPSTCSDEPVYMVYAPSWMDKNGGAIFLHRLVHELRAVGEKAYLWPMPSLNNDGFRNKTKKALRLDRYNQSPDLNTSVWPKKNCPDNAIVVYPEVTLGNPLEAKHIARWLMYPPGVRWPYQFTQDELFFKVSDFSDNPEITGGAQQLALWWLNPVYKNMERPDRSGTCYLLRKGGESADPEDLKDWLKLDGASHSEMAAAFNSCKTFVSYDEATMYSLFAAICGCVSVVIPKTYKTRADWVADRQIVKYGVAYGWDDLQHAKETQHLVLDHVMKRQEAAADSVRAFIETTRKEFGFQKVAP